MVNLLIGSVVGANIYVVTGIGSRLLGPSSLLLWIFTGIIALVIALSFTYCVVIVPRAGGDIEDISI
jgi:basic amino acid/polyamine antiporter, APA family